MRTPFRLLLFRWARELCCIGEHQGIPICDFAGEPERHESFLARTVEALDLLKEVDPRRFRRVQQHLACIAHVRQEHLWGALARYDPVLRTCYVCAASFTGEASDDRGPEQEECESPCGDLGADPVPGHREYLARWEKYEARLREYDTRSWKEDARSEECEALASEREALLREHEHLSREYDAREALAPAIDYAATLVHEATHGAVDARVSYTRENCLRIERLCLLEERRFLARHWPWADWLPQEPDEQFIMDPRQWPFLARLLTPGRWLSRRPDGVFTQEG